MVSSKRLYLISVYLFAIPAVGDDVVASKLLRQMGTRSVFQVPPTAETIAYNAFIFGYAGHSLVTPHQALKQLWWTDDRIEKRVTRQFVVSQIRGVERGFLDKPLGFGEGLTDETYMEWILSRARRLFLILAEVGKPEHIFGLIDDSLDDEDLPFSLANVKQLELSFDPDEKLSKNFYDTQFLYLLRQLQRGSHIDYGPNEFIPMEPYHKLPPAVPLQCWDRIHFPDDISRIFLRRKFVFEKEKSSHDEPAEYASDIDKAKYLKHEHICPIWASYTSNGAGYVLSEFLPEHTLGTFIAQRLPYQFMRIHAAERPVIVLEWLHCLSDAIASLHHRGTYHGAIRPTNIILDYENRIAFSDVGSLKTFQKGKKIDKKEMIEYAPPEIYDILSTLSTSKTDGTGVKMKREDSSSSEGSINSMFKASPVSSPISSPISFGFSRHRAKGIRNFSRHLSQQSTISECLPLSEPINATPALPPEEDGRSRKGSLASMTASTTTNITTITPSLPPMTPEELSPRSSIVESSKYGPTDYTQYANGHSSTKRYSHQSNSTLHPPTPLSPISPPSSPLSQTTYATARSRALSTTSAASTPSATSTTPTAATSFTLPNYRPTPKISITVPATPLLPSTVSITSLPQTSNPEAGDIFSLGCIFLDVLTYVVKGRLTEFQRFRAGAPPPGLSASSSASITSTRSTRSFMSYRPHRAFSRGCLDPAGLDGRFGRSSVDGGDSDAGNRKADEAKNKDGKGKMDSAFAAQLASGKLELWIEELRDASLLKLAATDPSKTLGKHSSSHSGGSGEDVKSDVVNEAVWVNGVPELLKLTKEMVALEPEDRPSAREVRDRVEEILAKGCWIGDLCCKGRQWESGEEGEWKGRRGSRGEGGRRVSGFVDGGGGGVKDDGSRTEEEGGTANVRGRVRNNIIDETIETKRSGGVPVRRRRVRLPWRKKEK